MSSTPTSRRRSFWKLLLLSPFIGLCWPAWYVRADPTLFGFPFFYWYQFVWVFLTAAIMALVYRKSTAKK